ncbi:MAG: hypothetical protein HYY37_00205 [Candidatus Aenigmarchaeota archaeon]|nr:hypothetical protein [Candidatus Aenigmarchaeota archaeon]
MKPASFLSFLAMVCIPLAFAVGGGSGGSSGGDTGGSTGGAAGGTSGGSSCSGICNIACGTNGAVTFTAIPAMENVTVINRAKNLSIRVPGIWRGDAFESDEAVLNEQGAYRIGDFTFSCPGLVFSCKIVNITITGCEKKGGNLSAAYRITNLDTTERLEYQFLTTGGRLLFHEKNKHSIELDQLNVTAQGTALFLTTPDPGITKFQINVKNCGSRFPATASISCIGNETEEFPCASLILTYDRVRCRLRLPDDEREAEAELYYLPEECRPMEGSARENCIGVYRSVQRCWKFAQGAARIGCVREQVSLGSFGEEKTACLVKSPSEKGQCIRSLREKLYAVIKFRFYDLEERAEEYLEKGADVGVVTDFVTSVEIMKQEFNKADTAEKRRGVILRVRDVWKEFLKAVK